MASDFVSNALASAHKALSDADKSNVSTRSGQPFEHEHADASYKMAHTSRKSPSLIDQAKSAGEDVKSGLEAKAANVKAYAEADQK